MLKLHIKNGGSFFFFIVCGWKYFCRTKKIYGKWKGGQDHLTLNTDNLYLTVMPFLHRKGTDCDSQMRFGWVWQNFWACMLIAYKPILLAFNFYQWIINFYQNPNSSLFSVKSFFKHFFYLQNSNLNFFFFQF